MDDPRKKKRKKRKKRYLVKELGSEVAWPALVLISCLGLGFVLSSVFLLVKWEALQQ